MKPSSAIAALVALGIALVATVGASAKPQAMTIQLRTLMNAAQEVPTPTGDVSGARGTFTATVNKLDVRQPHLVGAHVQRPSRERQRGPHPLGRNRASPGRSSWRSAGRVRTH